MPRPLSAQQPLAVVTPPRTSTIITPRSKPDLAEIADASQDAHDDQPDERQIDLTEAVAEAEAEAKSEDAATPTEAEATAVENDLSPADKLEAELDAELDAELEAHATDDDAEAKDETVQTVAENTAEIMAKPLVADRPDELLMPKAPEKDTTFIPPAAAKLPDEASVPATTEAPNTRPSLIHKISGLWSAKPADEASNATTDKAKVEPVADSKTEKASGSILDLPTVDMVQRGANNASDKTDEKPASTPVQPTLDNTGDDLDIPAFLRRQAN
jgi:cell division protein FtsZ